MIRKLLKVDFVRFCIVGSTGFAVNFAFLVLTYHIMHLPIFLAQIVSGEIALFNNFTFHYNWTYKSRKSSNKIKNLIFQFHLTSWAAIVGSAFLVSGGVKYLHINYLVALVISSAIALVWNFAWTKLVIWKRQDHVVAEV